MSNLTIRPATAADLPSMARLWQDKMTLLQQIDPRFSIAPDGQARWLQAAVDWLENPCFSVVVAAQQHTLVGYIIGCVQDGPPGLSSPRVGVVVEITVDAHSNQNGLGRQLLLPLRQWFSSQGITAFIVNVPHRQPVEQAFWRAMGASVLIDQIWIKV